MTLLVVIFVLMLLLLVGAPVIFAIGAAGFSYFFVKPDMIGSISIYAHKFFTGMDSFVFLAIPLFVLAGELMSSSGMMLYLVKFTQMLAGRFRGGLAYVNVLASTMFAGISGSALADCAALGPIEISMMKEDGYKPEFAAAITATSSIQGPIVPPSIPFVIFSSLTNVSVGALFMGGIIPGIMLGGSQILLIALMARKKNFPKHYEKFTFKQKLKITRSAIYSIAMTIIILGGILSGIFTATESAAVAVIYAFCISTFVYRNMTLKVLIEVLINTVKTTASIYLIIAFTSVIGWIFAMERVPDLITNLVNEYNISLYILLIIVNIFLLFNGMWISDTIQLLLFAPIFTPIFQSMGIHPVHFGVFMVVNVMLGMVTPPYGTALYLVSSISGSSLGSVVKEAIPFVLACIIVLLMITFIPALSLTIPSALGLI